MPGPGNGKYQGPGARWGSTGLSYSTLASVVQRGEAGTCGDGIRGAGTACTGPEGHGEDVGFYSRWVGKPKETFWRRSNLI